MSHAEPFPFDALYDPETLRAAGKRLADLLADHLQQVQSGNSKVLNWNDPRNNTAEALSQLSRGTKDGLLGRPSADIADRFAELISAALARGQNLHSPRYIGHQVPPPIPLAGLFDAVAAMTNQAMAIYEMGPWATAVETALIRTLGLKLGYPSGTFAGLVTHGGSIANLTALLTARNVTLGDVWETGLPPRGETPRGEKWAGPQPVLVAHAEAHYCIARSAGILGLGTANVIKPPLDDRRRMDPKAVDAALTKLKREGRPIIAVAASSCATPIGAFDPLNDIADVCEQHGVWLHVDAAHGGAAIFSEQHRPLLAGIERADSVVWDAHKMLFVPALCTFLFYKNRQHRYAAFRQDAPYLFDPSDPGLAEYDSGLSTLECTKRGATFGLWGVWSLFGESVFAALVDRTFALTQELYELMRSTPDFQPLHEPQCNILAFRHLPEALRNAEDGTVAAFQLELRTRIIRSGRFYIVPTSKDGVAALRCTVMNPLTTPAELTALLDELRRQGAEILSRSASQPPSANQPA